MYKYQKDIEVIGEYDVVVCGGGPAGFTAAVQTGGVKYAHLPADVTPVIPLGAMIPKGFKNLLVAGRCISGDRQAMASYRVKASCMAMGQAVGVTAALSLNERQDVKKVDVKKIRQILRENNAIVPGE